MRKKIGWILAGLFAPFLYLLTELYNFRSAVTELRFLWRHPGSALLGLLLVAMLFWAAAAVTRRVWVGALVSGILFWLMGVIHFLKTALNGDPFVPWDISMAGSLGELAGFVKLDFPWWGWMLPALLAAYIVGLWYCGVRLPKGIWYRVATAVAAPVLLIGFVSGGQTNFLRFGMSFMDAALQSSNYQANGLVSAFYLNLATMQVERPENYGAQAVETALQGVTASEGSTPDIIVVLCESFWDVRKLEGTVFSIDPMARFDAVCARANAHSGTLYSMAIGGGTVRTEFGVLSGLSAQYLPTGASPYIYPNAEVPTHVSYFKELGYDTEALHPYDKKFYSRSHGYPLIGFDVFYGQEEIEQMVPVTYQRGYVSDDSFVDALIARLEQPREQALFLWGISMENHQTYYPLEQTPEVTVQNDRLSEELRQTVTTYSQGVLHSAAALEKLADYVQNRKRDTLLVFFGDHLPTLGGNHASYAATGMFDGPAEDEAQAKLMYGTPFVIYANYPLSSEKAPTEISDYNLLPLALQLGGVKRSAYMNWQLQQMENVPYYSNLLDFDTTAEKAAFSAAHRLLTYDRLVGEQYSK